MSGIASMLILEQKAQLGYSSNNSSLEMKMVRLSDRYNGNSLYYSSVFVCFKWFIIKGFFFLIKKTEVETKNKKEKGSKGRKEK